MNIFDIDPKQMDDMATEYFNSMYESQYDESNDDQSDGNPHIKVLTKEDIEAINEEIPF